MTVYWASFHSFLCCRIVLKLSEELLQLSMGLLHSIIIGWFDLSLVHPLSYLFELGGLCLFLMHKALMGIRCRSSHSRL